MPNSSPRTSISWSKCLNHDLRKLTWSAARRRSRDGREAGNHRYPENKRDSANFIGLIPMVPMLALPTQWPSWTQPRCMTDLNPAENKYRTLSSR